MEKVVLVYDFGNISVDIVRKNIKNVHLKVFRDCTATLSVPLNTPFEWAENFVNSKKSWIAKQLEKYIRTSGYNNIVSIVNGSSTQMFGEDVRILVKSAMNNRVVKDENIITVFVDDTDNQEKVDRLFGEWWREQAYSIYDMVLNKLLPVFKPYGVKKPAICIKKMKTMWGSCSAKHNKITLNEYLLKAQIYCIEYVVLHELTHFIHHGHNQDFYDFLTVHMPDWQRRKNTLDTEVVQGL